MSAVSGDLTITPKKVAFTADKTAVTFPAATATSTYTVSVVSFDSYAFGKSLDMMLVSGDELVAFAETINSSDKGSVAVSFDKTKGVATFKSSATGPGEATSPDLKYVFVMGNDVAVSYDAGALIAGLSTDVKANKFGEFTVKVSATSASDDVTTSVPVSVLVLTAAEQTALGVTTLTSADYDSVSTDVTPFTTPQTALSTVSADAVGSSALVSIDLTPFTGKDAVALEFTVPQTAGSVLSTIVASSGDARIAMLDASMDVYYEYVAAGGVSADQVHVIGNSATFKTTNSISWKAAIDAGIVTFDATSMKINYVIVDANGKTFKTVSGQKYLVINDGNKDGKLIDPLWVTTRRQASTPPPSDSSSGVGCDAGFGAFALLGLAGLATILRKKD